MSHIREKICSKCENKFLHLLSSNNIFNEKDRLGQKLFQMREKCITLPKRQGDIISSNKLIHWKECVSTQLYLLNIFLNDDPNEMSNFICIFH